MLQEKGIHTSSFPLFVPFNLNIESKKWLKDFSVTPVDFSSAIKATLQYHDSIGWSNPKAGLSAEQEKSILGV